MSGSPKPSRWAIDLDPGMHSGKAARHVLNNRFAAIRAAAETTIKKNEHDTDALRRLRVATRRGAEAIGAFSAITDEESSKRTIRRLKKIRREAGAVRDYDLMLASLRTLQDNPPTKQTLPAIEHCLEHAPSHRDKAYLRFLDSTPKRAAKFETDSATLLESIRDKASGSPLSALASPIFAGFSDRLHRITAQEILEDPHQLRIELKKLKYTLEIFIGCASDKDVMLTAHADLARAQDMLGEMNDAEELENQINSLLSESDPSDLVRENAAILTAALRKRTLALRGAAQAWWTEQGGRGFVENIAIVCGATIANHTALEHRS